MNAVVYQGKTWDKGAIHALLDESDAAVARALMTIYSRQTADEQSSETTKHHNGVGFTARDAAWLSDIAKKWQRYGRWASERQCNAVRRAIKKYWRQLLAEIAEKAETEDDTTQRAAPAPAAVEAKRETPLIDEEFGMYG